MPPRETSVPRMTGSRFNNNNHSAHGTRMSMPQHYGAHPTNMTGANHNNNNMMRNYEPPSMNPMMNMRSFYNDNDTRPRMTASHMNTASIYNNSARPLSHMDQSATMRNFMDNHNMMSMRQNMRSSDGMSPSMREVGGMPMYSSGLRSHASLYGNNTPNLTMSKFAPHSMESNGLSRARSMRASSLPRPVYN